MKMFGDCCHDRLQRLGSDALIPVPVCSRLVSAVVAKQATYWNHLLAAGRWLGSLFHCENSGCIFL
jgi:hypothetical protein